MPTTPSSIVPHTPWFDSEELLDSQAPDVIVTVDGQRLEAGAGEVLVISAQTPHAFVNSGTSTLSMINLHPAPHMETEWL